MVVMVEVVVVVVLVVALVGVIVYVRMYVDVSYIFIHEVRDNVNRR